MAIYRGPGGAGDATTDSSTEAAAAVNAAAQAATSATQAASSATQSANSATAASSSASSASTSASTATTKANEAASSASDASVSALAASTSATNAAASASTATTQANNASTSATSASTSASTAQSAATLATSKATDASNAASVATTKATEAATSASNAATSATNAASSASSASTSASTATTQASNAATSATAAAASASTATTKASEAATSATNAATSATNAANSATAAATSATNASNSASAASTSATNAASSATSAASSASAAAASYDSFDDRYLGPKSVAPTVDNDGNTLLVGALYFNTVSNFMKVWDGSSWLDAYASLSGALLAANNLSDLANAATARTNLGLGTAALVADNTLVHLAGTETITGAKTFSSTITGSITGNAGTVTNGVYTTGSYSDPTWLTLSKAKVGLGNVENTALSTSTFNLGTTSITYGRASGAQSLTGISIDGNAGTVTNGVYTTGSYADPTWLTSIAGSKVSGNISGNAATATTATNQSGGTVAATTGSFSSSVTLSGGTANGVAYLNGSKVLTTGSALTFDGANFATTGNFTLDNNKSIYIKNASASAQQILTLGSDNNVYLGQVSNPTAGNLYSYGNAQIFNAGGSEQMRLTSTGLGIGTSSPNGKLDVAAGNVFITQDYELNWHTGGTKRSQIIGDSSNNLKFSNRVGGVLTNTMTLDSSGNLGLGVTPSAWSSIFKTIDFSNTASLAGSSSGANLFNNAYYNGSSYVYKITDTAERYLQGSGGHYWYTAPSGTAGTAITFTQAMTLDASGNLGIGTSSPARKLDVNGNSIFRGYATLYGTGQSSTLFLNNTAYEYAIYPDASNNLIFADWNAAQTRMTLNASGNLGLGVTPSAWSTLKGLQVGNASVAGFNNYAYLNSNAYFNGSAWTYISSGYAGKYEQVNSVHAWYTAPSGTAGNAISFTQAMTLDAGGNLFLSNTSNNVVIGNSASGVMYLGGGSTNTTTVIIQTGSSEKMRIDSSGNVGIGTSSPSVKLHVKSGNGSQIIADNAGEVYSGFDIFNNGTRKAFVQNNNTNNLLYLGSDTGGLACYTNGSERMRISSAGNVGIANTSPAYKLDVTGDINFTGTLYKNGSVFSGGAKGGGTDAIFYENDQTVTTNYTITTNKNAMSAGPITIATGVTVTVPTGSTWVIV